MGEDPKFCTEQNPIRLESVPAKSAEDDGKDDECRRRTNEGSGLPSQKVVFPTLTLTLTVTLTITKFTATDGGPLR